MGPPWGSLPRGRSKHPKKGSRLAFEPEMWAQFWLGWRLLWDLGQGPHCTRFAVGWIWLPRR